jgi:hypothetical protein
MRTVDARGREAGLSFADYQDWRRDARVFDGPSAAFAIGTISLGRDGAAPEQFEGLYVSSDTFSVLRVKPALGRDFSAADDRPGAEPVAIISSNIWKSRYAASRDMLGRKVTVNAATPATIVGVMPDGIRFIDFTDVWMPLAQMPGLAGQRRDTRPLMMIGRLPDDAGLDRVRAGLTPIAANLAAAHPDTNKDIRPLVNTLLEAYNGGGAMALTNSAFYMPVLAATFVLLIAAANLANLLLARAAYRSREIAIRAAIGATRWRIVRQLLIESLLLAFVAWVLALGLSWLTLNWTSRGDPLLPYWRLKMDVRLLGFLAAVALLTTGLFGLAPALYASRRGTADGLKEGGRLSSTPKARRWTNALLVGQFALTLALLNGAGLTAKAFYKMYGLDLNVQTSDAITTFVRLPAQKYATPEQRVAFHTQLRDRLLAIPGVTGEHRRQCAALHVRWQAPADRRGWTARERSASGRHDGGRGARVLSHCRPRARPRRVVLRDARDARPRGGDREPAIRRCLPRRRESDRSSPRAPAATSTTDLPERSRRPAPPVRVTIVGVSPDIRQSQRRRADGVSAVSGRGAGRGHADRARVRRRRPASFGRPRRGERDRSRSRAWRREDAGRAARSLEGGFGRNGVAVREDRRPGARLSGVGLYSAIAYAVRRRTQEIAIRMALGARQRMCAGCS